MNARIETAAAIGGARLYRSPKAVELHPARGLAIAICVSLLLWAAGLTLLFTA